MTLIKVLWCSTRGFVGIVSRGLGGLVEGPRFAGTTSAGAGGEYRLDVGDGAHGPGVAIPGDAGAVAFSTSSHGREVIG